MNHKTLEPIVQKKNGRNISQQSADIPIESKSQFPVRWDGSNQRPTKEGTRPLRSLELLPVFHLVVVLEPLERGQVFGNRRRNHVNLI